MTITVKERKLLDIRTVISRLDILEHVASKMAQLVKEHWKEFAYIDNPECGEIRPRVLFKKLCKHYNICIRYPQCGVAHSPIIDEMLKLLENDFYIIPDRNGKIILCRKD